MDMDGINFTFPEKEEVVDEIEEGGLKFDGLGKAKKSIIKVIGVGGGGSNAVKHMYNEGIYDVTYVVCNTDSKSLNSNPVPNKLQLGKDGLGAGNKPEKARDAAVESMEEIKAMLNDGTRMVFITAGMGGGTGTGASPIIAKCAKEMDILTVGIVTIPFRWEQKKKINQALNGVEELAKYVDALLVINNERLREIFHEETMEHGFAKADDTLLVAVRSIVEIINMDGIINLDFEDVKTVLKDGGVAVMSSGYAEGEKRVTNAITEALSSPLLNNNDIYNSQKILLNINYSPTNDPMRVEEMREIDEFMHRFSENVETKWGFAPVDTMTGGIKITILATGFNLTAMPDIKNGQDDIEEENEMRRRRFYDEEEKLCIFIFRPDDMDNEETISKVYSLPTCKRKPEDMRHMRKRTATPAAPAKQE